MSFFPSVFRCVSTSVVVALAAFSTAAFSTEYYVDSRAGNDAASGTSPDQAWRSLERVAGAEELAPGDVVRFKAGEVWRGSLLPRSGAEGAPITYTSWGEGAKPSFWRSVSLAKEEDWTKVGENLWATRMPSVRTLGPVADFFGGDTWLHCEHGASAVCEGREENGDRSYSFEIKQNGEASNYIQWFRKTTPIKKGRYYRATFDAKASEPFEPRVTMIKNGTPWTGVADLIAGRPQIGTETGRVELIFRTTVDEPNARLNFSLGLAPNGLKLELSNFSAEEVECDAFDFGPDVGNIILDGRDGKRAAFKRWTKEDLKAQDDFLYEREEGRVWFYSEENPGKRYPFMEAAIMRHVVNHAGVSDAIFDGLDVRYGAAHGFGGSNARRVVIRNCDISWIGGGDQYAQGGAGRRVRYGNGIEFWSDASDNLVENCRIWEVYDAAITNQGAGENEERNIVYHNNLIWNCEYSFEYWNRDERSITDNISFVDNVCLNAGYGWGHVQRPDKNGRCLMFYSNTAQTTNFTISGNIFANAVESLVRSDVQWAPEEPKLDGNVYWQDDESRPYVFWRIKTRYSKSEFGAFQKDSGWDENARIEPVDVEKLIPSDLK